MIETPARAKNVSQPDRNIQFWQKFFSREYIQCSNLPCLIQFWVVGSLSSKLSFTKDGHRFSVGNHFGVLPPRRTSWCVEYLSVF